MSRDQRLQAGRRVLRMSPRLFALPVVNGSADFALAVRDELLSHRYDGLAVPLPAVFRDEVLAAVEMLPEIRIVVRACDQEGSRFAYVPIDPCQPVIHAIRIALQERIPIRFVDLDVPEFLPESGLHPDAYALTRISPAQFATAVLPASERPEPGGDRDRRVRHMAFELAKLELDHESLLFLPPVLDWPWIRDAHARRAPYPEERPYFAPVSSWLVARGTLAFLLGELPWVTHLYEARRRELGEEGSLGIDGIKAIALEARDRLVRRRRAARRRVTTKALAIWLQYVRNLALVRRRLRPDLFTMVEAAKQVFGDDYAITLLETARDYPEQPVEGGPFVRMAPGRGDLPDQGTRPLTNLLPGDALAWRSLDLRPEPEPASKSRWSRTWNPFSQCSFPPEDERIESFNRHVREQAKAVMQSDLARTEKFSASVKDGIDIRETLRNWHDGGIWVRELPPARGSIDTVVFLFDVPADPAVYSWRTTWFAEHHDESTLVFFATNYLENMVGPGIAQARYGGCFFIWPPRPLPEVWRDPTFAEYGTLEERLLAAAFFHSSERHVAVVSPCPMKATWRRIARRFGKAPVHLPLNRFSASTVERLRTFHVLNGRDVRSYASRFIRRTE